MDSIVGSQAVISTDEDHEIAVVRTNLRILGTISRVSQNTALDAVQGVDIRLTLPGAKQAVATPPASAHFNWKPMQRGMPAITCLFHTPVASIRQGDIVCYINDTTQPTIVRPQHEHMRCIIIAITTTPIGKSDVGKSPNKLPQATSPAIMDVPIVWDWGISDRPPEADRHGVDADFLKHHGYENLIWMADTLRIEEGYAKVTPLTLFNAILYKSESRLTSFQKLSTLSRYRSSDIRITIRESGSADSDCGVLHNAHTANLGLDLTSRPPAYL